MTSPDRFGADLPHPQVGEIVREVREVGVEDWQRWREVRLRALLDSPSAFGSTYEFEAAFTRQLWEARLADPDAVSVLLEEGGAAVAMGAGYQDLPGFLHVVAMWVEPSARGHGVGARVLDHLRAWADARGLRLHLDVVTVNAGARRSYERYGFVGTGELRPVREGAAELVERMVLPSSPEA
jgi:GNAT superfamily N-acetyltransferase